MTCRTQTSSAMARLVLLVLLGAGLPQAMACSPSSAVVESGRRGADEGPRPEVPSSVPPPQIQAWMDSLTVAHAYDAETGFIVAKEVIDLPPIIADGPPLADAIAAGRAESRDVVVFATADRCAPCQQFKKSTLNDPVVLAALGRSGLVVSHIEVDRQAEAADRWLGGRAIPMTYLFRNGERIAELRGQRSAQQLLEWLRINSKQG
ncbi:MAG: thioredoxin family protein [Planctomycetota bacterium]